MTFEDWLSDHKELLWKFDHAQLIEIAPFLQEAFMAGQKAEREALCAGLMQAHEEVKGTHNYYQVAADKLRREE